MPPDFTPLQTSTVALVPNLVASTSIFHRVVGAMIHMGDFVGERAVEFEVKGARDDGKLVGVGKEVEVAAVFLDNLVFLPVDGLERNVFDRFGAHGLNGLDAQCSKTGAKWKGGGADGRRGRRTVACRRKRRRTRVCRRGT